ncbi:hypothetical protein [Paracoccus aestuariivivens]|uniref:DUF1376 domain-containing protein n=1 Tax=Paracoccus aestuariivivens TaxID=1820333 RepID=A0A6L6J6I6_9RHOB|nr:hypothetical protein [Paracoccus aestuariivivens]MTH76329.1 hypothetical protein [Paracoccus aestuariivivens]
MTMVLRSVNPIPVDDLPEYPIASGLRLDSHFFMMFNYRRWMNSDFRSLADREVRGVAVDLFCAAQEQSPIGTLPTDERLLANAVDVPLDVWRQLNNREITPLHNWRRCICDNGQIRLFHPVVLEVAQSALGMKGDHEEKLANDRERKRLGQLPAQIIRAGGSRQMSEDDAYIVRLDQYLLDHFGSKQRRPNVVREAMERMELDAMTAAG